MKRVAEVPDRRMPHRIRLRERIGGPQSRQPPADEADVEFTDLSPAAPPNRNHPLVEALCQSGVRSVEPKQAWTDVARFTALGIPAVNFGPGTQAQAHQKNEWTSVPQLEEGREILSRFLSAIEAK